MPTLQSSTRAGLTNCLTFSSLCEGHPYSTSCKPLCLTQSRTSHDKQLGADMSALLSDMEKTWSPFTAFQKSQGQNKDEIHLYETSDTSETASEQVRLCSTCWRNTRTTTFAVYTMQSIQSSTSRYTIGYQPTSHYHMPVLSANGVAVPLQVEQLAVAQTMTAPGEAFVCSLVWAVEHLSVCPVRLLLYSSFLYILLHALETFLLPRRCFTAGVMVAIHNYITHPWTHLQGW